MSDIFVPLHGPDASAPPAEPTSPPAPAPEPTPPAPKSKLTPEAQNEVNRILAEDRRKNERKWQAEIDSANGKLGRLTQEHEAAAAKLAEATARAESEAQARAETQKNLDAYLLNSAVAQSELMPGDVTVNYLVHQLAYRIEGGQPVVTLPPDAINAAAEPGAPPVTQPKTLPLVEAVEILKHSHPMLLKYPGTGGIGGHSGHGRDGDLPVAGQTIQARHFVDASGRVDMKRYLSLKKMGMRP